MSIWLFLLIIGLALLTGHGARAKAAAVTFFLVGIIVGSTFFGQMMHEGIDHIAGIFS